MKRRVVVLLAVVLVLASAASAFAFEQKSRTYSWMASYDRAGQLNLYATIGFYYLGWEVDAGPEIILGSFDISGVPFEWGLMARGLLAFGSASGFASWTDWGVAPMATLHWGTDFGSGLKFEFYGALGLGLYGTTGTYYSFTGGPFIGFAGALGAAWHFADNFALILDYAYVGWTGVYGIGLKVNI